MVLSQEYFCGRAYSIIWFCQIIVKYGLISFQGSISTFNFVAHFKNVLFLASKITLVHCKYLVNTLLWSIAFLLEPDDSDV